MSESNALKVFRSFIIGFCGSCVSTFVTGGDMSIEQIAGIGLLIFALILFISFIPSLNAYHQMVYTGNLKGLWYNGQLDKLIKNTYKKSRVIKIKVTRGYNLFNNQKGIFYDCFYNEIYQEKKKVKILLHYPCTKSDHLRNRARANQISIEKYIENLFEVLKKFKDHTSSHQTDEDIEVKFFEDKYVNWRYYLFQLNNKRQVLLFNHYDDRTPGAKSKMLKILGGKESLCDDLDRTFEDIFNHDSVELMSNNRDNIQLINSDFCGHPTCEELIKKTHKIIFKT